MTTSPSCAACGGHTVPAFVHEGFDFHRCTDRSCRHVFVDPAPSEGEILALYEAAESSIANSDSWTLASDYARDPDIVRRHITDNRIAALWRDAPCSRNKATAILDIGCSTGLFLRVLKDFGYTNLMGMDVSLAAAAFVRDTHRIACVTSLDDVPDQSFDVVTCFAVLEHVAEPAGFVRVLGRKLKPGGRLVALSPNYDSFYRRLARRSWVWLTPPIHLQYFSPSSFRSVIHSGGLTVERMHTTYGSTYLYLVMHHVTRWLGRGMPSTSRTRGGVSMAAINLVEMLLRLFLAPARGIAKLLDEGAEVVVVARRAQ